MDNINIITTEKLTESETLEKETAIEENSQFENTVGESEIKKTDDAFIEGTIETAENEVVTVEEITQEIISDAFIEEEIKSDEIIANENVLAEKKQEENNDTDFKVEQEELISETSGNLFEEKQIETKEVVISEEKLNLESGLEIKYTSLQLKEFPINYSNFSNKLTFDEIISIGTTSVKIGNDTISNAALKILVYDKFKLLEIKTREFKLALSIDLTDEHTLVKKDDYFKYEIFSKVKTSRFGEVVNILKRVFSGEVIEFKYNKLTGNISFENRIEVYKFTVLTESIEIYKEVIKKLSLHREKNIGEMKDTFYTLFLIGSSLRKEKLSSWINFRIPNNYEINPGDTLIFERIHKLKLNGISFDLKEYIKVLDPITQREITSNNEICCYRKAAEISLEQIKKSDMKR